MTSNEVSAQSLENDVQTIKENKSRIDISSFLKGVENVKKGVTVTNEFLEMFKKAIEGKNWEQAKKIWTDTYAEFHGDYEYIMISRKETEEILNSKSNFLKFYDKMRELESGLEKVVAQAPKIECGFKILIALPEGYQNIRQAQLDKKLADAGVTPAQLREAYDQMKSALAIADAVLAFAPKGMSSYYDFIFKSYEAMGVAINIVDKYQRLISKNSTSLDALGKNMNERDRMIQKVLDW